MASNSSVFRVNIAEITDVVGNIEARKKAAIQLYLGVESAKLEAEAKQNKPWENRTSNALNSIKGISAVEGNKAKVGLSGGMEYSQHLELAHGKKYAVLEPTVKANTERILRNLKLFV